MSKKNFKTAFDSLLGEGETKPIQKLNPQEIRATFIIKSEHQEKLRSIAYFDRKKIKDVLDEALSQYFANHQTTDFSGDPSK